MFYNDIPIAELFASFVEWGFLMAVLFNLVNFSSAANRATSPLYISVTIAISYFVSGFCELNTWVYLKWHLSDLLTIAIILMVGRWYAKGKSIALCYCVGGLIFNALLHLAMHFDLQVSANTHPWWLWTVYSVGMNASDIIMILVLITNRDLLGLHFLARKVKGKRYAQRRAAQ